MQLREVTDPDQWDQYVNQHHYGHPLQLWAWGELKRHNGWLPVRVFLEDGDQPVAAAQVLLWRIPRSRRTVAYVPRGPVVEPSTKAAMAMLSALADLAKGERALYLKIEPAWTTADLPSGWVKSSEEIILSQTYVIDLTKDDDELAAAMRSKTRQYVRQAAANGVKVKKLEPGGDLSDFWRIYKDTADRAGFGIHALDYYRQLFESFGVHNSVYFAEVNGRPEAFLWLVEGAGIAVELYGGMTSAGGAAKANYLLKGEAIIAMKAAGNRLYDFSGRLNEGVSQFKTGFGPDELDYIGSYDRPFNRVLYWLWLTFLPALKPLGRKFLKRGIVK